jgi:hypothetical protein
MCSKTDIYINKAREKHGDKYDYSLVDYKTAKIKISIICKNHGIFYQTPNAHLNGLGCRLCGNKKISERFFIPWEIQLPKFIEIHKNKYDYSKVIYKGVEEKIIVICPEHGEFSIKAGDHKRRGCPKCSKENMIINKSYTQKEIIDKFISIWGNTYDYSLTKYVNSYTKVKIICKIHGVFEQLHSNHFRYGCGKCRKISERNELLKKECSKNFIEKANIIHNNKYTYNNSFYVSTATKLTVTCQLHGDFQITPNNHLRGRECHKCSKQYSKNSIQWLEYLIIKYSIFIQHATNIGEFNIPGTHLKADGYCKQTNTIYEFLGDFWHGNPDVFDLLDINKRTNTTYLELYNNTIDKKEKIINLGYNYIEIWENNWNKFIKTVKNVQRIWKYYH